MRLTPPILLFAGALVVRILFNVYVMGFEDSGFQLYPDSKDYDALGLSLASGSGFADNHSPNIYRPPGYPFFLAAIYGRLGHHYAAVTIVQSIVGALTCVLVLLIGERLFTRRVGMIAATLAAVYPFLIVYTGFVLAETLFVFLSTLLLYILVRLQESPSKGLIALGGMVLGLMNLTRPVTLFLPAVLLLWLWIEFGSRWRALVIASAMTGWMLLVILPWTGRNYAVTHSVILINSSDYYWSALYGANNRTIMQDPEAIGGWIEPGRVEGYRTDYLLEDYRSAYFSFLRQSLAQAPLELLRLELHKLKRFWSLLPKTAYRDQVISLLSYGLLLPLFVIGMVLSMKTPRKPWLLICWVLYFCLVTLITYGSTRLRLPVEPVLLLFGSVALERLRFTRRTRGVHTEACAA
jgi:4-amino-4-deoxy-L-arabinose transferase-like glycosyltransferase